MNKLKGRICMSFSVLFFSAFSPGNLTGVHRFSEEMIKGMKRSEQNFQYIYWYNERERIISFIRLLKDFFFTITKVKIIHFAVMTPIHIPFILFAKILGKKIVTTYHGNYSLQKSITEKPYLKFVFDLGDRIFRKYSDAIVSPSLYLFNQLGLDKDKSFVIPNPSDVPDRRNLNPSSEKNANELLLITASNFNIKEKVYALFDLLDVFDQISKDVKSLKIKVFGDGKYMIDFKDRYSHNQNISFMGFRDDFRSFFEISDAYIHFSSFDNQPYAIIDALMHSNVVVCNNLEGLIEMLNPSDNYITELEHSAINNTICKVINDITKNDEKYKSKGSRNRAHAINKFSYQTVIPKYIFVYNQLLS